VQTTYALLALN